MLEGRSATFTLEKTEPPPADDGELKLERVFERSLTLTRANRGLLANLRHAFGPSVHDRDERTFWRGDAPRDQNRRRAAAGGQAGPDGLP